MKQRGLTNDEICEAFVITRTKGETPELRNSKGSIFASGNVLYSYGLHYPLLAYVPASDSRPACWLLNSRKYSVTTSHHQSDAYRRARHTGLPVIDHYMTGHDYSISDVKPARIKVRDEALTAYLACKNPGTRPAFKALAALESAQASLAEICQFLGEPVPDLPEITPQQAERLATTRVLLALSVA